MQRFNITKTVFTALYKQEQYDQVCLTLGWSSVVFSLCLFKEKKRMTYSDPIAIVTLKWPSPPFRWPKVTLRWPIAVSLSLLHSHTCFIYEANMRHIWDKYAAFMMQISIIFSKNEVLSTTIFEYCQNIIKLLFLMFQCTVVKP